MSIKLAVAGHPAIDISDETITLGSDPSCTVSVAESSGAMPKHAVIRKIAGRWLIEVRDGETIFVGNSEPKRLFWLNSGDVIHLTEEGPAITFKTSDDDPLPLPTPAASDIVRDVILPPDSNPSIPVKRPGSSASIPIPKPPSSGTIKIPNSPSSTIKTTKPPSSGTIRTRPPSSTTIRTVNPAGGSKPTDKLSRSSSDIPVPGAPLKRKSSQHQIPTSDDDEVANVPTLQRLSSWDDEDPTQRRGLTEEQAEMRWIMMVVGRSVGAGLAVLVVWLGISSAWKAMSPAPLEAVSSSSQPPNEQNVVSPSPPPPSPPVHRASNNSEAVRAKPAVARDSDSRPGKNNPDGPSSTAADNQANDRKPKGSNAAAAVGKNDRSSDSKKPASEDSRSENTTDSKSASPVMRQVKEGIYAVVVEDRETSKQIQLGTAWAASNRYLVTSATVVSALEEQRQQGLLASVIQISTGKSFRIKSTRMHDSYRKASESAEEAREQRDVSKLATERATQVRYDLGLLDVGRAERLPHKIASLADPLDDSKDSVFVAVGLPFQQKEGADSAELNESSLKERRCKKPTTGSAPQNKEMELLIEFGPDSSGRNWTGCPILNKDHKVIGVYSYLPSTGAIGNKPVKTETGVAWIGRLHEFAPEVE